MLPELFSRITNSRSADLRPHVASLYWGHIEFNHFNLRSCIPDNTNRDIVRYHLINLFNRLNSIDYLNALNTEQNGLYE